MNSCLLIANTLLMLYLTRIRQKCDISSNTAMSSDNKKSEH